MLLSGDLVLWDSEVSIHDKKELGLELATLGELSRHRVPILPRIIITPVSFASFLKENGLDAQIKHLLGTLNHERHDSLVQIGNYTKNLIEKAQIPKEIYLKIFKKVEHLNSKQVAIRAFYFREGKQIESKSWENIEGESVIIDYIRKAWAYLYKLEHLKKHSIHHVNYHNFSVVICIEPVYAYELSGHIKTETQVKGEFEIEAHTLVNYRYNKHSKKITKGEVLGDRGKESLSVSDIKKLLTYSHIVERVTFLPQKVLWVKKDGEIFINGIMPLADVGDRKDTYSSLIQAITVHPGITIGKLKVIDEKDGTALVVNNEIVLLKKLDRKMIETLKQARGIILEEEPDPEVKEILKSFGIPTIIKKDRNFLYSTGDVVSLNATTGEIKRGSMLVS